MPPQRLSEERLLEAVDSAFADESLWLRPTELPSHAAGRRLFMAVRAIPNGRVESCHVSLRHDSSDGRRDWQVTRSDWLDPEAAFGATAEQARPALKRRR
jgi:hypothetical protein